MNLKIQIISLVFSFVFGVLFGILINLNYKLVFNKNVKIRIIGTFSFLLDISLLYFFIIEKINYGILHIYFLLILFVGTYIGFTLTTFLRRKWVYK